MPKMVGDVFVVGAGSAEEARKVGQILDHHGKRNSQVSLRAVSLKFSWQYCWIFRNLLNGLIFSLIFSLIFGLIGLVFGLVGLIFSLIFGKDLQFISSGTPNMRCWMCKTAPSGEKTEDQNEKR